jgi:hypothetical protein
MTTAKELLDQLNNDPEYQKLIEHKEKIRLQAWQENLMDERDLVKEINDIGLKIESTADLVNNRSHRLCQGSFVGRYVAAYPILVRHLKIKHNKDIRDSIIRSLMELDAYDIAGGELLDEFYKEQDTDLKFTLAMAIKYITPKEELEKHKAVITFYGKYITQQGKMCPTA